MSFLFNELLYRPIFNFLVFLYNTIPGNDFGIAIVLLTVIFRVLFMPFSIKAIVSQKKLAQVQPKIKEIQEKLKHDKSAQAKAVMELYKAEGVNPMSGCLPLIIQLPVLFALYRALINGFDPENLNTLYSFVFNPQIINNISLSFLDLAVKSPVLAIAAGVFQFIQTKMSLSFQRASSGKNDTPDSNKGVQKKPDLSSNLMAMNKQMLYFFPIMIIIIAWNLPAGLVLYWVVATLFSVLEQMYIRRKYSTV